MSKINLPITRYYGSKRKLVDRIWNEIDSLGLQFDSVLDVFGGTAIFSYYSKVKGKRVIYNDIFRFNHLIGKKLIENSSNDLTYDEAISLLIPKPEKVYRDVIQKNFEGIYYTDCENKQIDIFIQNANEISDHNKRLSAYYLLFQACIIKRPYNLFHRNNLNMRTEYKGGRFGNKITWDRSFEDLFSRFIKELDKFTFDNGRDNLAINYTALECQHTADLVYIDPPYFGSDGSHVSYHSKYHFLEGLAHYDEIEANINDQKKNKQIEINASKEFERSSTFLGELEELILMHRDSHVVISYRNNGRPSIQQIEELMIRCKPIHKVYTINLGMYGYALSKNNLTNNEYLVIGTNHLVM